MPQAPAVVLLVQNRADDCEGLRTVLEREGYSVETAHDSEQVLRRLYDGRPRPRVLLVDASNNEFGLDRPPRREANLCGIPVLLDLVMPAGAGSGFRPQVTEFNGIPVVAYSGLGDRSRPRRAKVFTENRIELDRVLALVRRYCRVV